MGGMYGGVEVYLMRYSLSVPDQTSNLHRVLDKVALLHTIYLPTLHLQIPRQNRLQGNILYKSSSSPVLSVLGPRRLPTSPGLLIVILSHYTSPHSSLVSLHHFIPHPQLLDSSRST